MLIPQKIIFSPRICKPQALGESFPFRERNLISYSARANTCFAHFAIKFPRLRVLCKKYIIGAGSYSVKTAAPPALRTGIEIGIDHLEALDFLLWTHSGGKASKLLKASESSVSRKSRDCAAFFNLELIRSASQIVLTGDLRPLNAGRSFLQALRSAGIRPLRIHTNEKNIYQKLTNAQEQHNCLNHLEEDCEPEKIAALLTHSIIDVAIINLHRRSLYPPAGTVYLPLEVLSDKESFSLSSWSHPTIYGCDQFRKLIDVLRQP